MQLEILYVGTYLWPEGFRKTLVRLTYGALKKLNDWLRETQFLSFAQDIIRTQFILHHKLSQITYYFGGWSHLQNRNWSIITSVTRTRSCEKSIVFLKYFSLNMFAWFINSSYMYIYARVKWAQSCTIRWCHGLFQCIMSAIISSYLKAVK